MSYEEQGAGYAAVRRPDPRIADAVRAALGDVRSVVNVGAGTGSYEPHDLDVIPVEPSAVMRAQRPPDTPPAIDGKAEALPLPDGAADAALAVLTVHHWEEPAAGLAELLRVARRRVVVLTWDPAFAGDLWLVRDYLPEAAELDRARFQPLDDVATALGGARVEPVPIPHDCADGFLGAYWRRPERYLDPGVRPGISTFHSLPPEVVQPALARLAADLASGEWERRNAELLHLDELDLGYRLLVAERG
ncbi:MAG: methyltransferase domain-containing protein [Thermoleophilaceae bacterium]